MFKKCPQPKGNFFFGKQGSLQNSCKAGSAWDEIEARKISIPARIPDLKPIENIFHIVKKKLHQDALEMKIVRKDFEEFSARVKKILEKCTS